MAPEEKAAFTFRRSLRLAEPPADSDALLAAFGQHPSVATVEVAGDRLKIRYDASHLQIDGVLAILAGQGLLPAEGFWQRQRLSWYRYVDGNAAVNARRTDVHCCNKPPPGH